MNFSPRKLHGFAATVVVALLCAASTAAADSPVVLGHADANSADGGSSCTAYGYSVAGHNYNIPYDGVLTRYQAMVGDDHTSVTTDGVRLRTVHSNGSLESAYTASEGAPSSVLSLAPSSIASFASRVPAAAGDHLGIGTITASALIGQTKCTGAAISETGRTGIFNGDAAKDVSLTWSDAAGRTPNVQAMLEPDADKDAYGDASQDLCPGNASIHYFACTGELFGTNTAVTPTTSNLACAPAFNCLRVQTAINTISTAAPYNGVVVRWRASSDALANMRIRIVKPIDSSNFRVTRSSASTPIAATPQPANGGMPASMTIVPTRVPIDQGDFVGLDVPSGPAVYYGTAIPGSTYYDLANPADGGTVGKPAALDKQIFYNADIERDADGDGYGDETQDFCPTDAAVQTTCPSTADLTAPSISNFSVSPKKFRVAPKGAVVSKRVPQGTKFKLNLSEAASVDFSVYRVVKKKSKLIHEFTRAGKSGANSFKYSGRYRPAFKTMKLAAGSYRVKLVATDSAGNRSASRSASFTVVR